MSALSASLVPFVGAGLCVLLGGAVLGWSMVGSCSHSPCSDTVLTMKNAEQGLQLYSAKNKGKFPSSGAGLDAAAEYFSGGAVPLDGWGNPYQYRAAGFQIKNPYVLVSFGADGLLGGLGPDADIQSWNTSAACGY